MSTQSLTDDEPEDVASTSTANSGGTSNDSLTKHFTLEGCVTDLIEADNEQIDLPIATSRTAAISLNDSPYSHVGDVHSTIVHGENINIMITAADTEQTKGIAALAAGSTATRISKRNRSRKPVHIIIIALLLFFVGTVVILSSLATTADESVRTTTVVPPFEYGSYVDRAVWGAVTPETPPKKRTDPATLVVIKHTGGATCSTFVECSQRVRQIQREHMDVLNYSDISYNFLIGGDNVFYVGRGWGVYNEGRNDSVDIAYIGDFTDTNPTGNMVLLGTRLVNNGIFDEKAIAIEHAVINHNQTEPTLSPGERLFKEIARIFNYYSDKLCYFNSTDGIVIDYGCPYNE